jgi:dienelactone hydrolase
MSLTSGRSNSADRRGPWDTAALRQAPAHRASPEARQPGVRALLYEGLPYAGRKTEVFAYYAAPRGVPPAGGWPAVVCVHGGGGTAFYTWVERWNDRGYAAISMDLNGHYPITRRGAEQPADRIANPHPGPARVGVWGDYTRPIDQQWYYHALAQVMLAHSLIADFPEVDADRIGVTGISWGGILVSTLIGVDERLRFAVPVYGCGFLAGEGGPLDRHLGHADQRQFVLDHYDGSRYFDRVELPTLWINGTNDGVFDLAATQRSARAVGTRGQALFVFEMPHDHPPGWLRPEPYLLADHVLNNGPPLPRVSPPIVEGSTLRAAVEAEVPIHGAKLYDTTDPCPWTQRKWRSTRAHLDGGRVCAEAPEGATAAYFEVSYGDGALSTSFYVEGV